MSAPAYVEHVRAALEANSADPRVVDSELLKCLMELEVPELMQNPSWREHAPEAYRGKENGHDSSNAFWMASLERCRKYVEASREELK